MVEQQLRRRGIRAPAVLDAMRTVPRHLFVAEALAEEAYADHPLPLGAGQTISQPYMVAVMTELLEVTPACRVLEIGTGSGYQTAILAELAGEVYTVERIAALSEHAQVMLERLGYRKIAFLIDDGTVGWQAHAPYQRILVTAGAPLVPATLIEQLADDGKIVIPVGDRFSQMLQVITKHGNELHTSASCPCVFVKLLGKQGWAE